jgi:hypothetical protein
MWRRRITAACFHRTASAETAKTAIQINLFPLDAMIM